jgi:flagellar biosynthesis protein FlhA
VVPAAADRYGRQDGTGTGMDQPATRSTGRVPLNPRRLSQLVVPIGIVMIIVMMVVPMPSLLLDLLIAMNITAALLVVLVSMQVSKPLDFSVFPALILVATLFRLALNISATRLVLLNGFAGNVIDAFGHFVVGGSLIVGLVIFVILIVIQFVVITRGAERVAEVGARFTLDAMPGKQMAIDADLNSGLIDETEARRRRAEVAAEADFYGAMDGASKFVKGDAIAAIIITVINLIGGMAVGILQRKLSPGEAVSTYSLLSIGDGLVSQIPALMLSVATGLIVTRSATEGDMGTSVVDQLSQHRRPIQIAGGAVLALCLIPALPKIPFLVIGGAVLLAAQRMKWRPTRPSRRPRSRTRSRRTRPRHCSARCGSTRWSWPCPPTWSTWSTRQLGIFWTESGHFAVRWPWSWDWSCRRCAPGTTSTFRCPRT